MKLGLIDRVQLALLLDERKKPREYDKDLAMYSLNLGRQLKLQLNFEMGLFHLHLDVFIFLWYNSN